MRFCKELEERCKDWNWANDRKVAQLPQYTSSEALRNVCKALDGFKTEDWDTFKNALLIQFEGRDKKLYSASRLKKLVDAYAANPDPKDLEQYVLEYKKISNVLIQNGIMTAFSQVKEIFWGLSTNLRRTVLNAFPNLGHLLIREDGSFNGLKITIEAVYQKILEKGALLQDAERLNGKKKIGTDKEVNLVVPELKLAENK